MTAEDRITLESVGFHIRWHIIGEDNHWRGWNLTGKDEISLENVIYYGRERDLTGGVGILGEKGTDVGNA